MNPVRDQLVSIFDKIDFDKIIDHPNILIAANFWEEDRYRAAKTCYKFMRAIDDMIDNYKAENKIIENNRKDEFILNVNEWLSMIRVPGQCDGLVKDLADTIETFRIPFWPMQDFARSMIYDIHNDGFPTMESFLDYSGGASVAPASIFVHLDGLQKVNSHYEDPPFDVKWASTPCAIFSYLVHIIRDFQKDQLNNLNYFANDLIEKNNLTLADLRQFASGRPVNEDFRKLVSHYYSLADSYRVMTYDVITKIRPLLEPRYQFSLELIFNLYLMVFERIDLRKGTFTTEELNPTPDETRCRVYDTILRFN